MIFFLTQITIIYTSSTDIIYRYTFILKSHVAGTILDQQPRRIMVDSSGDKITNIGINTPWRVGVEVVGDNANSTIIMGSTAEFINGWANYSSNFALLYIVYPSSAPFQVMSNVSITVRSAFFFQSGRK